MSAVVAIGVYYAKRANKSSDEYYLGGRSLGPWVTAMSAEASDMSGWLLMGLPGVAYWCGLADAAWTAIGLAIGTYLNWLIVSKRLRRYSIRVENSITLPDFFSNRFREKKPVHHKADCIQDGHAPKAPERNKQIVAAIYQRPKCADQHG